MFKTLFSTFVIVGLVDFGYAYSVSYVTRCNAADSKCIKKSSQPVIPIFAKGIPEIGVESLDPAVFKETIDASTSGLKLILKDLVTIGLKDCQMKKIERDVTLSKIKGKLLCNVDVTGHYEMDGLLLVPVKGQGKIHVVLRKLLIDLDADLGQKTGKDGKTYWDVKRFNHTFKLQDKADVEFENLFSDNEVLGRAAREVIAANGNEIVLEVGPPVVRAMVTKVITNIKKFFNNVPYDELSLD